MGRTRQPRRQPAGKEPVGNRQDFPKARRPATVRISVSIPLASKRWLASQARAQQRFVSEIVMEALDRYAEEASPPSGRAKRVAVPDGTICNIVLPVEARQQLDDAVARKNTTRSALLTRGSQPGRGPLTGPASPGTSPCGGLVVPVPLAQPIGP